MKRVKDTMDYAINILLATAIVNARFPPIKVEQSADLLPSEDAVLQAPIKTKTLRAFPLLAGDVSCCTESSGGSQVAL